MNPLEITGLALLRAAAADQLARASMAEMIPMSFITVDVGNVKMSARARLTASQSTWRRPGRIRRNRAGFCDILRGPFAPWRPAFVTAPST
jgi:hypothetical protein